MAYKALGLKTGTKVPLLPPDCAQVPRGKDEDADDSITVRLFCARLDAFEHLRLTDVARAGEHDACHDGA